MAKSPIFGKSQKQLHGQNGEQNQRRAEIRLLENEQCRDRYGEQRFPEILQPAVASPAQHRGQRNGEHEFRRLGGLKGSERAERDPALRSERAVPAAQNEEQQQQIRSTYNPGAQRCQLR